jgi:heme oxygenase
MNLSALINRLNPVYLYRYFTDSEQLDSSEQADIKKEETEKLSQGKIHSNLITADSYRKQYEETINGFLPQLFYKNEELHKAVESFAFFKNLKQKLATEQDYKQYLVDLYQVLSTLEELFQTASFPHKDLIDLSSYYRTGALKQDLKEIEKVTDKACEPNAVIAQQTKRFKALNEKNPPLLVIHIVLQYLAILHGGRVMVKYLKNTWENIPLNFSQFPNPSDKVRMDLLERLKKYGDTLDSKVYPAFAKEMIIAWIFAGDVVGKDIRELAKQKIDLDEIERVEEISKN